MEQILQSLHPSEACFWSTYSGAEVDLLVFKGGKRYGIEFKFNEAPKVTKSMHIAINFLSFLSIFLHACAASVSYHPWFMEKLYD